jgi:hypothetical protein
VPAGEDRTRDADWHGYVNMSPTRINADLFDIASKKWQPNRLALIEVLARIPR